MQQYLNVHFLEFVDISLFVIIVILNFHTLNYLICRSVIEGDHISVKKRGNLPFRHAVVVEPVQDVKDKVRLVYHSGSNSSARVEYIEVDLHKQASNGELYRHGYEAVVCYPGQRPFI